MILQARRLVRDSILGIERPQVDLDDQDWLEDLAQAEELAEAARQAAAQEAAQVAALLQPSSTAALGPCMDDALASKPGPCRVVRRHCCSAFCCQPCLPADAMLVELDSSHSRDCAGWLAGSHIIQGTDEQTSAGVKCSICCTAFSCWMSLLYVWSPKPPLNTLQHRDLPMLQEAAQQAEQPVDGQAADTEMREAGGASSVC